MTEGYLLLASGPARYAEMARNAAASLRVMDPARRICLVHDQHFQPDGVDARLFDDFSLLPDHPFYPGFMNKIRLHGTSPYSRTMFVDADCLLVKRDIDTHWDNAAARPFGITGRRQVRGEWKGSEVSRLLAQEGAPYLVRMNSGVFCFDDTTASADFFAGLNDFYRRRHHALGVGLHRGRPTQTDEIYIGLWMGLCGMDSCVDNTARDRWMNSTWRAFDVAVDAEAGTSRIRKPTRSIAGIPNPVAGWETLSPSLVHFVGLKPRATYARLARHFMEVATGSCRSSPHLDRGRRTAFRQALLTAARIGRSPLRSSGLAQPARSPAG